MQTLVIHVQIQTFEPTLLIRTVFCSPRHYWEKFHFSDLLRFIEPGDYRPGRSVLSLGSVFAQLL